MIDAIIYLVLLGLGSAIAAYVVIFRVAPALGLGSRSAPRGQAAPHVSHPAPHADPMLVEHHAPLAAHPAPQAHHAPAQDRRRTFSAYEGFRSFATGPELTVEDIVKGLSRK